MVGHCGVKERAAFSQLPRFTSAHVCVSVWGKWGKQLRLLPAIPLSIATCIVCAGVSVLSVCDDGTDVA